MAEYIERKAIYETLYDADAITFRGMEIFRNFPAADVAEVKHGEWKPYQTPIETRQSGWICTNCSGVVKDLSNGNTNFCPNCGADMQKNDE